MADTYPNFAELARHERAGIDYGIQVRRERPEFAIVAPHGGGIEPGTSEIADAIAAKAFSFCSFEGLKSSGNSDLHITSTHFDEPMCLTLLESTVVAITIHGEATGASGESIFVGGLDTALGEEIADELAQSGFDIQEYGDSDLQGKEKENICNRGTSGAGVQLELSRALRETMFDSLSKSGREHPTERLGVFAGAIARVLARRSERGG